MSTESVDDLVKATQLISEVMRLGFESRRTMDTLRDITAL